MPWLIPAKHALLHAKDVKGAGASLSADDRVTGEGVQSGEARRRMDADAERRAAARAAGESEYGSALPEGFAGGVMDLEENGGVFKGRGDAAYDYMRDRDVARDVVARLFARASGLEAGDEATARTGVRVKLDGGNRKALRGAGNRAVEESGEAMRVCMDLHAAHGFTHAFATDGSKEGGRRGRTAYGLWSGADMVKHGAEEAAGEQLLRTSNEQEVSAVGDGLEGGRLPSAWEVVDAVARVP